MSIAINPSKPPLALIAGPTASGKSAMAVELALALEKRGSRGVVINADSAQVYRDLQVLSARPDTEEMRGVEHVLFGEWDGSDACSAADWAARAKSEISKAHANGAVPILVGGTGMYLQVLLDGIAPIPAIDPHIREEVRRLSAEELHKALLTEDTEAAERLAPKDTQRMARALEVVRSTARALRDWQAHKEGGIAQDVTLHPLILLPMREWLYERCNRRFVQMLDHGAVEEVAALLKRELDPGLPVMGAIGVREIVGLLQGQLSRDEAIVAGQTATRQYAKRQYTWFRNQTPSDWPRLELLRAPPVDFESQNYDIEALFALLLREND
jgi:tRNA dimethylallyltransferase